MTGLRQILTSLLFLPMVCMAEDDLLTRFLDNLEKHTLQSDFTVTITEKATQPTTITGTIVMRGEQFKAQLMGMEIAYDGITLYSYSEDNDELTLSSPTPDELADVNPLLFTKALGESCQTETKEQAGNYIVTLLPNQPGSGVRDFSLQIRKHDLMPLYAAMRETSMKTTTLLFRNPQFSDMNADFTISKPDAYINDLR